MRALPSLQPRLPARSSRSRARGHAWTYLIGLLVSLIGASARADDGMAGAFRAALEGGSTGSALLLSFLAGVATSLTPCVYPMIAITVSVFGARAVQTRAEGALLSSAFVAGMTVLFSALGIGAALTGGVFGDELGNPVIAFGLAFVFLLMAASMFGAFELALPHSITTKLSDMGGIGYRGAFVLGMASSVIAAPCVGPVLGLLLPWIGTTGNVGFGVACMVSYSLGMGLLFWVVGTFAVALPKSGRWMEWVKSAFGLVMIASALYFVRAWLPGYTRITQDSIFTIVGLSALVGGLALGAVHASFSAGGAVRARKTTGILVASLGALLLIGRLEAKPAHAGWEADLVSARQKAKAAASPMLIDFGASWCQACGELERHTFSDPRVISEISRFVKVKVDLSPGQDVARGREWLGTYGARGLPLVVLHDSQGNERARVTEFVEAEKMLELLRAVN
jgi:thiol:disulfide interchange protein DsbD